jgi:hypothetical protein
MQMTGPEKPIEDDTNAMRTPIVSQPPRLARRGRGENITYTITAQLPFDERDTKNKKSRACLFVMNGDEGFTPDAYVKL